MLRLKKVAESFKIVQIIMLRKPDKPLHDVSSYKPIILTASDIKTIRKITPKETKVTIWTKIPDSQFKFRSQYAIVEQVQKLVTLIENVRRKETLHCSIPRWLVGICQSLTWGGNLQTQLIMPENLRRLLKFYLENPKFQVIAKIKHPASNPSKLMCLKEKHLQTTQL